MMTNTTWHTPCTRLGAHAWEVTLARGPRLTLLCEPHDEQMRSGEMPWVKLAIPVRQ